MKFRETYLPKDTDGIKNTESGNDALESDMFNFELDFVELTGGQSDSVYFKISSCPFSVENGDVIITPEFVCRKKFPQQWGGLLKQIANGKLY